MSSANLLQWESLCDDRLDLSAREQSEQSGEVLQEPKRLELLQPVYFNVLIIEAAGVDFKTTPFNPRAANLDKPAPTNQVFLMLRPARRITTTVHQST